MGEAFLRAVDASLTRIRRYPEAHPRVRRAPRRRFPYGVFYVVRDDRIDVLAVYHGRRRPRRFEG